MAAAFFAKTGHRFESDNLNAELRRGGVTGGNRSNNRMGCQRRAGRPDHPGQAVVLLLDAPPRGTGQAF